MWRPRRNSRDTVIVHAGPAADVAHPSIPGGVNQPAHLAVIADSPRALNELEAESSGMAHPRVG